MEFSRHFVTLLGLVASVGCGRWNYDALASEDAGAGDTIDAAAPDPIDAAPIDPCSDSLLCSSFEETGLSEWQHVFSLGTADMATTTTRAFRGNRALEVQVFSSGDTGMVGHQFSTPFTAGEVWVRGWVYVPSAYGPDSLSALMYLSEGSDPQQYMDSTLTTNRGFIYRERSLSGADIDLSAPIVMSDTWRCFEWNVALGPMGHIDLYVDSTLLVESGVQNMETQGGGFSHVYIGQSDPLQIVPGSPIFIDEVVISRQRRGCDFDIFPSP